jgi:hypothetical protein
MSAFKIYSSLDQKGQKPGLRSIIVFAALAFIPFGGFIGRLFSESFNQKFGTVVTSFSLILLIILAFAAYLFTKKLKQIGSMFFYKSYISKQLGDLIENWEFNSIQKIVLSIHQNNVFFQKNKLGVRTYLFEIIFKNHQSQKFILSGISEEKSQFNLPDLLKTLCKTNHIELSSL